MRGRAGPAAGRAPARQAVVRLAGGRRLPGTAALSLPLHSHCRCILTAVALALALPWPSHCRGTGTALALALPWPCHTAVALSLPWPCHCLCFVTALALALPWPYCYCLALALPVSLKKPHGRVHTRRCRARRAGWRIQRMMRAAAGWRARWRHGRFTAVPCGIIF